MVTLADQVDTPPETGKLNSPWNPPVHGFTTRLTRVQPYERRTMVADYSCYNCQMYSVE